VKYVYFSSTADVEERAAELQTIATSWIDYKDGVGR
jgi:hypothetical protein